DDVDSALGHTVGEFLNRDRLREDHFAHDLLARLVVLRALELLLAAAHRGPRAATGFVARKSRGQRQLAASALFLALGLDGLGRNNRGLDGSTAESGGSARLFFLIVRSHDHSRNDRRLGSGSTATR